MNGKTFLLPAIIAFISCFSPQVLANAADLKGTVLFNQKGRIKVHTYIAPEKSLFSASHVIETSNRLVIIDAQFLREYASEFRGYIDGLKKPVDRVILSHSHPDHWFGLEFFKDVPVYALGETTGEISKYGDAMIKRKKMAFSNLVADEKVVPTRDITQSSEVIDGVLFEFIKITNAESACQLLVALPDDGVIAVQDLVYNNVHAFLGQNCLEGWSRSLQGLLGMKNFSLFLAGHGAPGNLSLINNMLSYLRSAEDALSGSSDGAGFKKKMQGLYPGYKGTSLIDLSLPALFRK